MGEGQALVIKHIKGGTGTLQTHESTYTTSNRTWGGLIMGVESREPYTPPLLMVKVPPAMSSILMVPSRAFLPRPLMVWEQQIV